MGHTALHSKANSMHMTHRAQGTHSTVHMWADTTYTHTLSLSSNTGAAHSTQYKLIYTLCADILSENYQKIWWNFASFSANFRRVFYQFSTMSSDLLLQWKSCLIFNLVSHHPKKKPLGQLNSLYFLLSDALYHSHAGPRLRACFCPITTTRPH